MVPGTASYDCLPIRVVHLYTQAAAAARHKQGLADIADHMVQHALNPRFMGGMTSYDTASKACQALARGRATWSAASRTLWTTTTSARSWKSSTPGTRLPTVGTDRNCWPRHRMSVQETRANNSHDDVASTMHLSLSDGKAFASTIAARRPYNYQSGVKDEVQDEPGGVTGMKAE